MNSTSHVPETSTRNQHPNVKEEVDADSVEMAIKVEGEEKPTVCQCEECGSGGRGRMARCTRAMTGCSSQAIKKEEWEGDDGQSGEARRDKRTEILVKEEVKEEEDEANMASPLTQRCGSASADSVIIKFEDEDVTCACEDCGMVKREEEEEEVKEEVEGANEVVPSHRVEEDVAVEGGGSEDEETVVEGGSEDEEDWLPATGSSLGLSSEEDEETEDDSTELVQEPIETVSSTAPLKVRPVAGADAEQAQTTRVRKRRRCPQCQKMVTNLTLHLLTHTDERPHICDQCGRSFKEKSTLNKHLLTHYGEKAFSCQQCGKSFTQKGQLTVHLKRHSGVKAHQCDQCPSAFVTSSELTSHRRHKHSTKRPFACLIANCDKAFASQSNLTIHLRCHNNEKKYQCEDCEMRFVTSSDLTSHRRYKHSTERPYRCHFANCDKALVSQSHLTAHLKYHSGEKRHHCEDCEMRFITSSDLTKHRHHKHSTERPHRCPHLGCNYAAATKGQLKRHLNSRKHRQ